MSIRRRHALHNEKVCVHLDNKENNGEFDDWVITTAFYSALHWVCHHLFPRSENDGTTLVTIENIDQYRDVVYGRRGMSKHQATIELVKETCPEIATKYASLYTNCANARYRDYAVSRKLVSKAKRNMEAIHNYCDNATVTTG